MQRGIKDKFLTKSTLFCVAFLVHLIMIPFYHTPFITDGLNPLALGFMLRGEDWSQYLIADGYYYKYGQLLFYLPFILLVKNNVILYKMLLIVNAIIASFIPVCAYDILTKHLRCIDHVKSFIIALLVGFIPAVTLNSKYSWAEPILMLLPWIILLLLLKIIEENTSTPQKWIYSIMIAVLQVYAYMVHTRGIIIFIATVLCVIFIRIVYKNRNIKWIPYSVVTLALFFLDRKSSEILRRLLYKGSDELVGGTTDFINRDFLRNLFSLDGLKVWGEEILGWLYASVCSSFGLTSVGIIVCVMVLLHYTEWKKQSKQEILIMVFSALCFAGALALGTVFFFNDIFVVESVEMAKRGDKLIYVRYLDAAGVCIAFIALYYLIVKKEFWTKTKLCYSIIVFSLLHGFFLSIISPRIDHTITWPYNLMTLNYFCDLDQCVRGGLYSQIGFLSGGIAVFGLISLGILIIAVLHKEKIKILFSVYLVSFLLCYFWNAYNVIYRTDAYVMDIVKGYFDVINNVSSQYDITNIYLDDEILRCGFQYIFSDCYVITERDVNRHDISDMFMISPKGDYNEELYDGDYYEIEDITDENDDYHLYIKGEMLNDALRELGYVTYQVQYVE